MTLGLRRWAEGVVPFTYSMFDVKTVVSVVGHGQAGRCDVTDLPN